MSQPQLVGCHLLLPKTPLAILSRHFLLYLLFTCFQFGSIAQKNNVPCVETITGKWLVHFQEGLEPDYRIDDSIGTHWPLYTYQFKDDSAFLQKDIMAEKESSTQKGKWWLSKDTLVIESYRPQTNQGFVFKRVIKFYHAGLFYETTRPIPGLFYFTVFMRLDVGQSESDVKEPVQSL